MERESNLRNQIDRGQTSEIVLKELEKAFEALENDCFNTFKSSDVHDDDGRKTCRLYLKVLEDVVERFRYSVINGKAASKELISIKKPSRLRKVING